jgi:hypothetical protein
MELGGRQFNERRKGSECEYRVVVLFPFHKKVFGLLLAAGWARTHMHGGGELAK